MTVQVRSFKTKMIGSDCLLKRDFFNAIGRGPANQDGGKFLACLYIRFKLIKDFES